MFGNIHINRLCNPIQSLFIRYSQGHESIVPETYIAFFLNE